MKDDVEEIVKRHGKKREMREVVQAPTKEIVFVEAKKSVKPV